MPTLSGSSPVEYYALTLAARRLGGLMRRGRLVLVLVVLGALVAPAGRATLPLLDLKCTATGQFTAKRMPVMIGDQTLDGYFWTFSAKGTCNPVIGARDVQITGVPFPGQGPGYTLAPFAIYSPFLTTTTLTNRKTGGVTKLRQAWFFDSPTAIHVGPLYVVRIYEAIPKKSPTTVGNQTGLGALVRFPPKRTETGAKDSGLMVFVFGMSIPVGPAPLPTVTPTILPTVEPTGLPTILPTESPTPLPTDSPTPTPSPSPT